MINHDKYMMINFLIFYEFLYKKYYFLTKNELEILHEKIRFFIEKSYRKLNFLLKDFLKKIKAYLMKNLMKKLIN